MKVRDVDPKIRRLFPWAFFLALATLLALGAMIVHANADGITCDEVVRRVGVKPLWVAERIARKEHPELTDEQIAWGKECVSDHRRAMLSQIKTKIEGYFE